MIKKTIHKIHPCLVKKNHKFLWWKWKSEYYKHAWVYENKEKRFCKKCNRNEMLYGTERHDGNDYEDWRESIYK